MNLKKLVIRDLSSALILLLGLMWCTSVSQVQAIEEDHSGHDHAMHEEEAEEDHRDHDHDAHAEEEGLRLTPEQRRRFGIQIDKAGPGVLNTELRFPGEIIFNEDRVVHLVPRVEGIARQVSKTIGDHVKANEVLAVIDSRELVDVKVAFISAKAWRDLAETNFKREKALREKKVSSEQDFLAAQQALTEACIELLASEQKLHALGLTEAEVEGLNPEHTEAIARYEIRSPIAGVVAAKHISLGENLDMSSDIFTIVDLSSVWVNLAVYTKNLPAVRKGQDVTLRLDHSGAQARGKIAMVTPFVDEATRSANARVVLDNSDGRWTPGTFVTGFINTSEKDIDVMVPKDAVQVIDGRNVVFVEHEGGFEMTPVKTGRSDRENIEIIEGLKAGDSFVVKGSFELKATAITSTLDSHAGHGH